MSAIALGHFTMFHHVTNWQGADTDEPGGNSADLGGGAAVMGFFCVSGFIMTIAYGDRDFTSAEWGAINRRNFYAKRFARLAPLASGALHAPRAPARLGCQLRCVPRCALLRSHRA